MNQCLQHGWSRNILGMHIENRSYERGGKATTNFDRTLPPLHSDMAQQTLKDPYIFDFLTLDSAFRERELETELVKHLEKFLLELGVGFAFVGRQYHIQIGNSDYYIDLLFYHLRLRCFVVIELKKGAFKPEYAGKLNLYLNIADDILRHKDDKPSIGLILCQDKNRIVAEYALRGLDKAIGVSEYQLTQSLPEELKSSLPTIEEIEREFVDIKE
jgi:predicted nuclease of restriction endonuclease-like (RecB) superfamily